LEFHSEKIQLAQNFAARSSDWLTPGNHHHLRLTRILRSLRLLGLESESQALFRALSQLYESHQGRITFKTYEFWKNASETPW
jgi:Opioid growth factor receptor (OGFr) conserved region